jgi:hypothetical protein
MEKLKRIRKSLILLSIIAVTAMVLMQTAATLEHLAPPPTATLKGNVTFACNGSIVPTGWIVSWNRYHRDTCT